ncbi:hypothetical protein ABT294_43970 [Nonomuraea sp. NPDC000554]|uniref:hypothetical protein n=1 Tax=Nonomuraea sp. NPDC000554 TaxID=3154259 RepID=UPI003332FF8C
MTHDRHDDLELAALVRELAAGHDHVHVVDFADLGTLPPHLRKAGHQRAAAQARRDRGRRGLAVRRHDDRRRDRVPHGGDGHGGSGRAAMRWIRS